MTDEAAGGWAKFYREAWESERHVHPGVLAATSIAQLLIVLGPPLSREELLAEVNERRAAEGKPPIHFGRLP